MQECRVLALHICLLTDWRPLWNPAAPARPWPQAPPQHALRSPLGRYGGPARRTRPRSPGSLDGVGTGCSWRETGRPHGGRSPLLHHRHSPARKSASLQAGRQTTHSQRGRQRSGPDGPSRTGRLRAAPVLGASAGPSGHGARGPAVLARDHSRGNSPLPQQFLKMTKRGFNFSEKQDQTKPPGWLVTCSP